MFLVGMNRAARYNPMNRRKLYKNFPDTILFRIREWLQDVLHRKGIQRSGIFGKILLLGSYIWTSNNAARVYCLLLKVFAIG
jgi:hypothetical protein